jgi:PAS domain S-box-containing protein
MGSSGGDWERLFWLVFERSANPIWLVDENRRIVQVNAAGAALLGRSREELVGTSMEQHIEPNERARARTDWARFQRGGDAYFGTRTLVRPDGSAVTVDFAAKLGRIEGRRLALVVSLLASGAEARDKEAAAPGAQLTDREREVVTLIAMGRETPEIARELHISAATVRTHVRNSMAKLGVHTRAQLVAVALCGAEFLHSDRIDASAHA